MSEEKPRLSRREMRERGLLKPAAEDAPSLIERESLTYTQEIRLGRISRRELRERETGTHTPQVQASVDAADSATTADEAAVIGERKSVFERFDSAPLIDDGTRRHRPRPASTGSTAASAASASAQSASTATGEVAALPRTDGAVSAVEPSDMGGATLQEKLLARVQHDVAENPWPGDNAPTNDVRGHVTGAIAAATAAAEKEEQSAPVEGPTRTPIAARPAAPELIDIDEDEEEDIPEEKPRGFLMLIAGIIVGAVVGILLGIWIRNALLSGADPLDFDTLRAAATAVPFIQLS